MPNYEKNSQKSNFVDISSNKQVKKLYNKKGRLKRILCLVFSIIFLLGGGGMLYYYSFLDTLNFKELDDTNNNTAATNSSVAPLESDATNLSLSEGELLQNSKELNVMLFGEDNSNGDKHGRSDTMIMMTIDNNHKKLNASYNYGGAKLSIQTIEANFGIKVDRYAVVDFDSFKKIIDTLGGIDIEVTQDEIDYINYQMYKNKQADTRTTITDAPGTVHLNGQEALWYARNRGLTKGEDGNEIGLDGDDWDRTSRQRKLLETLFTSMKSADLGQIVSIVSSVGPLVTTNLKKDEITALVSHALTYLSYDVEQYYVPEEGLWYYDDKTETWNGTITSTIKISDLEEQRKKFASFVFEELFTGGTSSKETTSASN